MSNVNLLVQAKLAMELAKAALTVEELESKRRSVPSSTGTHAQHLKLARQIKEATALREAWNNVLRAHAYSPETDDVPGVPE